MWKVDIYCFKLIKQVSCQWDVSTIFRLGLYTRQCTQISWGYFSLITENPWVFLTAHSHHPITVQTTVFDQIRHRSQTHSIFTNRAIIQFHKGLWIIKLRQINHYYRQLFTLLTFGLIHRYWEKNDLFYILDNSFYCDLIH